MEMTWIIARNGEYMIVSTSDTTYPLYGYGSWDLYVPTSFNTYEEAYTAMENIIKEIKMNEDKIYLCARCGMLIDLDNLHPDSLPVPQDGEYGEDFTAVHGAEDICGDDPRAWIIELK